MSADLPRRAAWVLWRTCILLFLVSDLDAQTRPPRPGTEDQRLLQRLLKEARTSLVLEGGWAVEGPTLPDIKAKYYTEEFLSSFEREWYRFIEKKILGKWELATVGGRKLRVGDSMPPPPKTEGFPLTDDRRGDLFLVKAEGGPVPVAFREEKWWMLKAWGVPVRFYQEAWKEAPELLLTEGHVPIIGSAYVLLTFEGPPGSRTRFFLLVPAWAPPPVDGGEELWRRLHRAVAGLIEKW